LVQLLGSDRQEELRDFVDDVDRVRAGETLNTVLSHDPSNSSVKPIESIVSTSSDKTSPKKAPPASNNNTKLKANGMAIAKQQKSYASVVPKKSNVKGNVQQPKESQQARKLDRKVSTSDQAIKEANVRREHQQQQEVMPLQGKAKVTWLFWYYA
jgi:hypothetical protein